MLLALRELRDEFSHNPYCYEDGAPRELDVVFVDSGHWGTTVFQFCKESGDPFKPAMGDPRFRMPTSRTRDKKPGKGGPWYYSRQPSRNWVVNFDPDAWKHFVHERFLTEPSEPGSLTIFGDDYKVHGNFANQVTAEIWKREFKEVKGWKEFWDKIRKDNHYLDCVVGCCVAGAMAGVNMIGQKSVRERRKVKLSEMQGG